MTNASMPAKAVSEVWKFRMEHMAETLALPVGAEFLHAHDQDGEPCLWFRVDPSTKKQQRIFRAIGTGHKVSADSVYLGTAHCGSLVWHVFEVTNV